VASVGSGITALTLRPLLNRCSLTRAVSPPTSRADHTDTNDTIHVDD
jgi:hypothetical protein